MESSNITVVTSITGGKDHLLENQAKGKARFTAFLDETQWSTDWEILQAYDRFVDPRRNSRIHKLLIHKYATTEYSIWIDGNMRLLVPPEQLVKKYLKDHDIALFRHPTRDCLYEEALTCAKQKLDDTEVIIEQAVAYEKNEYAKHKGLCECGIILRRNTPKVEEFNNAWWAEYTRYSKRDQISFMYALDKVGLRANIINDYFIDVEPTRAVKQGGEFEILVHQK
jgi:hypothetical protein